jgi:hypothetical protein
LPLVNINKLKKKEMQVIMGQKHNRTFGSWFFQIQDRYRRKNPRLMMLADHVVGQFPTQDREKINGSLKAQ